MASAYRHLDLAKASVSYLPGYIVLSYVVSLMGCATTLELLHRRTSRAGLYNWYLLLTSSITMGGIGIWCMHFIGNRAIVLADGDSHIQISYNVTFTAVSFVLPVCVVFVAFYTIGAAEKAGYVRILLGGVLTGSAVCGMHYIGQLGIANYSCVYVPGTVVGAAIIALVSATTALGVFFRWEASWTDSWWRRGLCAALLAVAVSGMHWTATVGTSYRNHDKTHQSSSQLSRSQTVIICAVLSCASCLLLSACAIIAGENRRRSTTRAHQLVLSCVFFDPAGRVMVTPQALLPSRKIVEHYVGRTFKDDDLTRTHPAFLWAFRASRNWKLIKDLVPFMKGRLESEHAVIQRHVRSRGGVTDKETELQVDFDTLFKQLFCVTAQELADDLRQPLQDLGILYDNIMTTVNPISRLSRAMGYTSSSTGKGQLVFTVRQLNKQEASRLAASGFRFATIEHVAPTLARRLHVAATGLGGSLRDMRDYATSSRNFQQGVHLISFVMRPTVNEHFELLTAKGVGNPLPSATLPTKRLQMRHMELLSHMDGWDMAMCIKWLRSEAAAMHYPDITDFRDELIHAVSELFISLPPHLNAAARLTARPLLAPCRGSRLSDEQHCVLLAFYAVAPLDTQISNPDYSFTPFRLFRLQQQVNDGVADHDGFSKELGQELFYSNVLSNMDPQDNNNSSTLNPLGPAGRQRSSASSRRFLPWPGRKRGLSAVSQESLVQSNSNPFGDIMVRKEIRVDVAKFEDSAAAAAAYPPVNKKLPHDSKITIAGGSAANNSTFVDELYNLCFAPGMRLRPDVTYQNQLDNV
ncbi:hypothetical protein ASPZODRAFT_57117 [Penicilliopsis zonata CBS 506.65]|uniref:MHYT domain-containing protein n=1 Tax=Penicilliopsis zonata CBS 506.65 TaxID=1073090 RepID=A0A1L9SUT2_9EURO|nr:hypothetical protein ASPZODRAFT_57117 [Penicilliopsis zonata CBS 506.65]OJJ50874.1 hypothetical protein ASPZODRAFT_57117 [Penicilliopsis zonata CBS 506.65]